MPSGPAAGRTRRGILVSLLGIVLVILNTWPLLPKLDRVGRADGFDGQYGLWQATWVARALVTDPLHVYDANIFFPHRSTLAFSEPSLLAGILGLPAYLITKSPYATHNLAVLSFFLLSFFGAYGLGRYLTGQVLPAVALAISYAFCPFVFARTAQLPMMAIFGLPLSLLAMHRLIDSPSAWTALGLAGALWLQALGCGYYTVFALLMVGFGLIFFGFEGGRWRSRAYLTWGAGAALLTVMFLLPLLWPHIRLAQTQGFARPIAEAYEFGADWRAWLASSAWAHRWMLPLLGTWNEVLFPGFIPTGLAVAAAWLGVRGRLSLPVKAPARAVVLFYVLLCILAGWSAFGPAGGLYTVLYHTVPLFAFIRAAGRFGIVVTLAAGVLMSLALAHWRGGTRLEPLAAVVLTVILAAELFAAPRPFTPPLPVSTVYDALAQQPRGPVVEFPMFPRQFERNARYVLMSTAHWQPLVNGYGAFWPTDIQQLANDTRDFPSEAALERIRQWGVRYVVVHPRAYEQQGFATEASVLAGLDALAPHLTPIAFAQEDRLYQVGHWTSLK
jgi:hypothetical protein